MQLNMPLPDSVAVQRCRLSSATFERKLSDVAYTLAEVFTVESQLPRTEWVLV